MIGEISCDTTPWRVVPVVVSQEQDFIAAGQVTSSDRLVEINEAKRDGTILVNFEPLYEGGFKDIVPGSQCIANVYSNNHDTIANPETPGLTKAALHGVDALGLVHAMLLRIQVAMMPFRTLVFSGGH